METSLQARQERMLRVGEQLRRELAALLRSQVKDPRIAEIVIYDVIVSRDLSLARVYFGLLDVRQDAAASLTGLQSASGFLRTQLSRALHLRRVPELRFIVDDTEIKSARIERLIKNGLDT